MKLTRRPNNSTNMCTRSFNLPWRIQLPNTTESRVGATFVKTNGKYQFSCALLENIPICGRVVVNRI